MEKITKLSVHVTEQGIERLKAGRWNLVHPNEKPMNALLIIGNEGAVPRVFTELEVKALLEEINMNTRSTYGSEWVHEIVTEFAFKQLGITL